MPSWQHYFIFIFGKLLKKGNNGNEKNQRRVNNQEKKYIDLPKLFFRQNLTGYSRHRKRKTCV